MASHDPYAALRLRDYRLYFCGNFVAIFGVQMQTTAVGWDIYTRTGSKLALGYTGLIQFLPIIALFLLSGHVADRFNRKWIIISAVSVVGISSAGLAVISIGGFDYRLIYLCLLAIGVARAFQQPAKASLLPLIVPPRHFASAVTWNSTSFHMASVLGPAAAGFLIKLSGGPTIVYVVDVVAASIFITSLLVLKVRHAQQVSRGLTFTELVAGFGFLRRNQIIFGAIALDLFAVLLGGAITLLPVYAEDILKTGPSGLGWMRAAPAVGALLMAVVLAHWPLRRAGKAMLWSVVGFGVATIVFGYSTSYPLSLVMLFLTGAFDNISVVVRHTLVQTLTPDHLRGRVSSINSLFIGASNELGGFESGLVAHLFSPVVSVVSGGVGTILVVAWAAAFFPKLRDVKRLSSDDS